MIVCNTLKDLTNATNTNDAAGAVAVKEYVAANGSALTPSSVVTVDEETTTLESYIADVAAENLELTSTTPVDVSGTEKTLQAYVEDVAEDQAQIYTDGVLETTTGTITSNYGTLESWSSVTKSGNVVNFNIGLTLTSDVASWSELVIFSDDFIPSDSKNIVCAMSKISDSYAAYAFQSQILTTGVFRLGISVSSGDVIRISGTYII